MGNLIHARKINGEMRYRMWNNTVDEYVTDELTEGELRHWLKVEAAEDATLTAYEHDLPDRLERAQSKGTSSLSAKAVDITSGWEMTWEEQLSALEGPGERVAKACLEALEYERCQELAAMSEENALVYAFTLLQESGIADPQLFLKTTGVLD